MKTMQTEASTKGNTTANKSLMHKSTIQLGKQNDLRQVMSTALKINNVRMSHLDNGPNNKKSRNSLSSQAHGAKGAPRKRQKS